ncbi:PrsW family glutamic-type intramembrane protease [Nonomuraea recticatena]|uniref:PrsW family intramembrane metalloprotease n=1 Tax=Nonomuraea recticatena TaxID=46178 RepID=A0ABP6E584_9ACTN
MAPGPAHPLWTSLIGLGVGYALVARGRARRPAIALGYAGATLLHFLWNHTIDGAPVVQAGAGPWNGAATWLAGMGKVYLLELTVAGALIAVTARERTRPPR